MMRDHLQLYSTHDTYSDETIYSSASASDSTNSSSRQSHKLRRQKSQLGNFKTAREGTPHNMSMHPQSQHQNPKQQQTQPYSAASQSGGGLRGVKQPSGAGSSGKTGGVGHKPQQQQSQHGRSVSLLSRIRHNASPSASPTSSDNSSRDTRSERTLAHSASAGSIRQAHQMARPANETAVSSQQRKLSVKVLPPQDSVETQRPVRKRNSFRGDGKSGGFISQFLSRRASSRSRSPHSRSEQTSAETQPIHRLARSPGTPQSQRSAGSGDSGNSSRSPASIDDSGIASGEHFHVSQCPYVSRPLPSTQNQPHSYSEQSGMYCMGGQNQGDMYYIHDNPAAMSEHVMHEPMAEREHMRAAYGHGMNEHEHTAAPYGHGGWYETTDAQVDSSRLVSALPVYEPIDMARMVEPRGNSSRYLRATQPMLPDAQMLAPMASLAGVCGASDSSAALSNRELRFAVENHMLVEQHRYLIRDLGHARSAIGALKQVVQAKEERLEHCELANIELQQRIALLESVLTPEQRQHVLACMPYTSSSSPSGQPLEVGTTDASECSQPTSIEESSALTAASGDNQAGHIPGRYDLASTNTGNGYLGGALPTQPQNGSEADGKRINRPLSGFATGYSFSDRPVHQLPRVFSGDYSSSDVQAMENSVETLASAIAAMPRDGDSVEDIIAAKPNEDECDVNNTYDSAAERSVTGGEGSSSNWQHSQNSMAASPPPAPPKRRSRFFSALRKSAAGSSSAGEAVPGSSTLKQKRRSVSLGNHVRAQAAQILETADDSQRLETGRSRADTDESLVASCPTLLPNIAKSRPLQKQRLSSASSQSSNGRYPSSLGLGLESGENSRQPSQQSSITSHTSEVAKTSGNGRRKISQRFSFTPQPRRSTSAPSRPHSMRVTSRKSWLLQLFGVGGSSSSDYFDEDDIANDESAMDDSRLDAAKSRRRRVMTQSSDEISQFLGRLRLEENTPHSMAGSSGILEDLLDDSDEDGECGQSPLSVAQVRQQTLEALNGTFRGAKQAEAAKQQQVIDDSHDDADTVDVAGSRWSTRWQKGTLSPTIHRLADTRPTVLSSSASSMGLGIGASSHGSAQSQEQCADAFSGSRRPRSNTGGAESLRVPRPVEGDGLEHTGGGTNRWAPAFWAPPPQAPSSASGMPTTSTWSPRNSIDSADTAESLGHHASDSSKRFRQSPPGSFNLAASGSSQGSQRGNSPWELVKMTDAHTFPISPSHSRSGSPPSRALAFFEDTTVPDSDELTAAARRSLSLRMSRNSFKQVEPLPETDDSADSSVQHQLPTVQDGSSPDMRKSALGPQNPALARVAASTQTKRRSILWQLNAKLASKPLQQAENHEDSLSKDRAASENTPPAIPVTSNVQVASDSARRSKKWWSSVLG